MRLLIAAAVFVTTGSILTAYGSTTTGAVLAIAGGVALFGVALVAFRHYATGR